MKKEGRLFVAVVAPFHVGCAPGESTSKGGEDDVVAFAELLFVVPKGEGNGAGRSIAVALDVEHYFVHRHFEAVGDCFDDAHIGLVGKHPSDVVLVEVVAFGNQGARVAHGGHGILVDGAAFLVNLVHVVVDGEVRGRAGRTAAFEAEIGQALAVGTEVAVFPTEVFGGAFYQDCAYAVAEDGAGGAVVVVHDAGELVATANDDFLVATALYHGSAHVHGIKEATAGRVEVDAKCVFQSGASDHDARRAGDGHVWRGGGHDEAFDFFGVGARLFEQLLDGFTCHVAGAKAFFVENAAFFDADARHDPLIVGVYHARQFFVVEDVLRNVTTHSGDYCIDFLHWCFGKKSDIARRFVSTSRIRANARTAEVGQEALPVRSIFLPDVVAGTRD